MQKRCSMRRQSKAMFLGGSVRLKAMHAIQRVNSRHAECED